MPEPGSASSRTNACSTCATWSPPTVTAVHHGAVLLGGFFAISESVLPTWLSDAQVDLGPLVAELGDDVVVTDPERMEKYRWDRANDPDAGVPLAVVRAGSTEDVQAAVRFAAAHGLPVVPRGAGSGLSGGASAVDGCLVVSTERMTAIDVDPVTRTAVVQPGLMNAEVKAAAAEHDLWYPPDPSSYEICSIGGNIATNAGGLCCVKYGVTTDYVLGLTVVLADGTAVRLGGARLKDVAGLSLTKLFVGSEGTLGIITEIVLRLVPKQRPPATLVATFATLDDATATVLAITRRLRPSMLEFMDRPTINAVEDMTKMGLDRDGRRDAGHPVRRAGRPRRGRVRADRRALRGPPRHRGLLHRRPRGGRGVRGRPSQRHPGRRAHRHPAARGRRRAAPAARRPRRRHRGDRRRRAR